MRIQTSFVILFLVFFNSVSLQANFSKTPINDTINPDTFDHELFEQIILNKINSTIKTKGKDTFKVKENLNLAARDQAIYMSKKKIVTAYQEYSEKQFTAFRAQHYGGSMVALEIVEKTGIRNGNIFFTYEEACENLVDKLFKKSKNASLLLNNEFNLIGLGAFPDMDNRKVYVSIVLGNFKSYSTDKLLKESLEVPYTNRYFGLTAPNQKYCRKVKQTPDIFEFQKSLVVRDRKIYFETDDVKKLNIFLKNYHDGISVDILQKGQFRYDSVNIVNYNNLNRGILLRPTYTKKIFRKNKANTHDNRYALSVKLGKLPKKLNEPYELNLVLIQSKSICACIPQSFLMYTSGKYHHHVDYIPDMNIDDQINTYKPIADSIMLDFRIPFERNKYHFKRKDVEPFLQYLNIPEFIIYQLDLIAYSSVEGSVKKNLALQKHREKSILDAIQERQSEPIETSSTTDFNWSDFKQDIKNTPYKELADMTLTEVQSYIEKKNLFKELEPILKNHRYAALKMHVRYNIEGLNEPPFVTGEFNRAINSSNLPLAASIQKYIIKQVIEYKYSDSILRNLNIPAGREYVRMEMNRLIILQQAGKIPDSLFIKELTQLHELNTEDEFVSYNLLLCMINQSEFTYLVDNYTPIQSDIEHLYLSTLPRNYIDDLNIKYQMRLIASNDSLTVEPGLETLCVNKLKDIVNIKEDNIGNSQKLAAIYIENEEFGLARKVLENWVSYGFNEELLFTYISLCSLSEWDMHTQKFYDAMENASKVDQTRFCELFYSDKFSYRIFENSDVKKLYCKTCQGNKNKQTTYKSVSGVSEIKDEPQQ